MNAAVAGLNLFLAALGSVASRPMIALPLFGAFVVIDSLLGKLEDMYPDAGGLFMLLTVVDVLLLGTIASIWHRKVLLSGASQVTAKIAGGYGLAWLVLGVCIMLVLLPLGVLIWYADLIFFEFIPTSDDPVMMSLIDSVSGILILGYALGGWAFLILLYRFGMGLPHIALERGNLGFRASWARTAPLSGPIVFLALIAGLAQLPLMIAPWFVPFDGTQDPVRLINLIGSLGYGVIILVGAAILTELYRQTAPDLTR